MQTTREIICNSCSDVAVEFDNDVVSISDMDGTKHVCKSCSLLGRVSVDEDEGHVYVKFVILTKSELSHVDFGLMVEAYEAAQDKIEQLMDELFEEKKERAF